MTFKAWGQEIRSKLHYRILSYRAAKRHLGFVNVNCPSKKREAMASLNRKRGLLVKEINRMRWKVWPKTGRPAAIWEVYDTHPYERPVVGSVYECRNYITLHPEQRWKMRPFLR